MVISDETKQKINKIEGHNVFIIQGGMTVDESRKMGDVTGNTFGPNTNFQGDNVAQTNVEQNSLIEKALTDLKREIESITDEDSKEEATMYYEMLQKSIKENKKSRIKKCIEEIRGVVGTVASLASIASFFGITL